MIPYFIREVEKQVGDLSGVDSVELETDHGLEWTGDTMSDEAKARRGKLFARQAEKYEEELGPSGRANRRGES
jgi:metal-sulfur cluster biosynthetic enzyme